MTREYRAISSPGERRWLPDGRTSPDDLFLSPRHEVRSQVVRFPQRRLYLLGIVAVLLLCGIAARSVSLQLASGRVFRSRAEGNRLRLLIDYAPRGVMFDRFGRQLVQNVPVTSLVLYPAQLPENVEPIIGVLRELFPDLSLGSLRDILTTVDRSSQKPVPLLTPITHEQLVAVLARAADLPGIGAESRAVREYVGNGTFAHVIGYTGYITKEEHATYPDYLLTESIGKAGLERSYERLLRGTHGARHVEVDASGTVVNNLGVIPARPGVSLRIHIDAALQEKLTTLLAARLKDAGVRRGAAVALDPRSGAVRALVRLPTYDHTAPARGVSSMGRNQFSA